MTDNLLNDDHIEEQEPENFLEALVSENETFKDQEALAKKAWHADRHAKRIERENAELRAEYLRMREQLDAGSRVEELLQTLKARGESVIDNQNGNEPPKTPVLDESKVEQLVLNKLEETQRKQIEAKNFALVQAKLEEKYGKSYATHLRKQTQALELTDEEVNTLAKKSPKAFLKAFGLEEQSNDRNLFQAPPQSNQRNDNFAPKGGPKRNYAYYKKIRKENPELYNQLRVQMDQDAIAMREKFYEP